MSRHDGAPDGPGPLELIALLFVFTFSTVAQKSVTLQKLILQDGHHIGEINQFLRLLQLGTGMLFLGFSISYLLGR